MRLLTLHLDLCMHPKRFTIEYKILSELTRN